MNVFVFFTDRLQILVNNIPNQEVGSFFSLTFNELLTLVVAISGVWIAICQFRKQMRESRESAKQTQKENWYLSVIVLPQIESINAFYRYIIDDCISDLHDANFSRLTTIGITAMSQDDLGWIANNQEMYKEKINSFFDHITSMARSYSPGLAISLSNLVMELEDDSIDLLNPLKGRSDNEKVRRVILGNKQRFISALYNNLT